MTENNKRSSNQINKVDKNVEYDINLPNVVYGIPRHIEQVLQESGMSIENYGIRLYGMRRPIKDYDIRLYVVQRHIEQVLQKSGISLPIENNGYGIRLYGIPHDIKDYGTPEDYYIQSPLDEGNDGPVAGWQPIDEGNNKPRRWWWQTIDGGNSKPRRWWWQSTDD